MSILSVIEDVFGLHPKEDFGENVSKEVKVGLVLASATHDVLEIVAPEAADAEQAAIAIAGKLKEALDTALAQMHKSAPVTIPIVPAAAPEAAPVQAAVPGATVTPPAAPVPPAPPEHSAP